MATLEERWKALGSPWRPGMLAYTPEGTRVGRVVERLRTGGVRLEGGGNVGWRCVPHWTDDATRGALLGLVRERWPGAWWGVRNTGWGVYAPNVGRIGEGDTEAEALIAALECANG